MHGGADKIGHMDAAYIIADVVSLYVRDEYKLSTWNASLVGAGYSLAMTTLMELGDGSSKDHGFSWGDMIFNAGGALFSMIKNNVPGLDNKITLRIQWMPRTQDFRKHGKLFDDYERYKYVAALKLSGFDSLKDSFWRFLELQLSFKTRGYEPNSKSAVIAQITTSTNRYKKRRPLDLRYQSIGVGFGIDVGQVLIAMCGKKKKWVRMTDRTLNYLQLPYTTAEINRRF